MTSIEILEKLISFNTIMDKDNFMIMDFVGDFLSKKGFEVEYIFNNEQNKKCLIAKINNPNLMFIGHTDTVNYSNWTYDPFKLTKDGNKLHGLGACDMKGGIAAFLSAVNELDLTMLSKGIMIALTFDEETNFGGISLISKYQKNWPENIIVGEPTSLIPVTNTKGCMEYRVNFKGISAHSSRLNKGKNAILMCMDFIQELRAFSEELKSDTIDLFEIPYTTMNVALINGGHAVNAVPENCDLNFDFRTIKRNQHELIRNRITELCQKYDAKVDEITNLYPLENNNPNANYYEEVTGNKKQSFNYVTEASVLDKDNVIILGVGPNNEHMKDEYVDINSYNETIRIYKEIINHYCK